MVSASAPRIRTEVQVMFFDTDCAAVVHNIAYLRFIEIARTLLAEQLGLGLPRWPKTRSIRSSSEPKSIIGVPAQLGDRLVVEGWLDSSERVRFWCAFRITRPADEALIAECRQMLAIIEMPMSRLLRLPEEWDKYRLPITEGR